MSSRAARERRLGRLLNSQNSPLTTSSVVERRITLQGQAGCRGHLKRWAGWQGQGTAEVVERRITLRGQDEGRGHKMMGRDDGAGCRQGHENSHFGSQRNKPARVQLQRVSRGHARRRGSNWQAPHSKRHTAADMQSKQGAHLYMGTFRYRSAVTPLTTYSHQKSANGATCGSQ